MELNEILQEYESIDKEISGKLGKHKTEKIDLEL